MRWADGHRTHHLQVVVYGAEPRCERMRFRDALRTRPELAARYAALKIKLSTQHATDRDAYTNAKEQFVRSVSKDV